MAISLPSSRRRPVCRGRPAGEALHRNRLDTLRAVKCPIDDSPLSVSSRDGVEIDFCPQCRGVWLDRGELDKIIDRAANAMAVTAPPERYDDRRRDDDRRYEEPRRYDDDHRSGDRRRRKKNFLDDLFDFG
jgi:Zn-finger nucleic acid-binding protein